MEAGFYCGATPRRNTAAMARYGVLAGFGAVRAGFAAFGRFARRRKDCMAASAAVSIEQWHCRAQAFSARSVSPRKTTRDL